MKNKINWLGHFQKIFLIFLVSLLSLPLAQSQRLRTESVEGYREWQDDSFFTGVWLKQTGRQTIVKDKSWNDLVAAWKKLSASPKSPPKSTRSYRDSKSTKTKYRTKPLRPTSSSRPVKPYMLIDVEYDRNSGLTGVFQEGTLSQKLVQVDSWKKFATEWERNSKNGFRLIDFETYNGGRKYFVGVFSAGKDGYYLYRHSNWGTFLKTANANHKKGLRLIDFETDIEGNTRFYTGVWRSGRYGNYIYRLTGWKAFTDKWKAMGKKNYRLVDVEMYKQGGQEIYIGVWRSGQQNYYLWKQQSWAQFSKKLEELKRKGYQLVDLETNR